MDYNDNVSLDDFEDANLWDEYDSSIDPNEANSKKDFDGPEVPTGKYEVTIDSLRIVPTKNEPKRPMLSVWFKIIAGPEVGRYIFYNQLVDTSQRVGISLSFLRKLCKEKSQKDSIKYTKMSEYSQLVKSIGELLPKKYDWAIEYTKVPGKTDPSKLFTKINVIDIFEKGSITKA